MSVASFYTQCFVMFCVFLYGPFCHGAHKPDLSTLFTTFFHCTSLPFIFSTAFVKVYLNKNNCFSYETFLESFWVFKLILGVLTH